MDHSISFGNPSNDCLSLFILVISAALGTKILPPQQQQPNSNVKIKKKFWSMYEGFRLKMRTISKIYEKIVYY